MAHSSNAAPASQGRERDGWMMTIAEIDARNAILAEMHAKARWHIGPLPEGAVHVIDDIISRVGSADPWGGYRVRPTYQKYSYYRLPDGSCIQVPQ